MRTFLGFPAGNTLKHELERVSNSLPSERSLKTVDPENFHLTVKFLGDRTRNELEELDRSLQRRLPTPGSFSLDVSGLGAFPDLEHPSVIWAGVEMNDRLIDFAEAVEKISVEHGAEEENRDYHAHITLARMKDSLDEKGSLIEWIQEAGERQYGLLESDRLVLFESDLTPEGPTYHELEWWPL